MKKYFNWISIMFVIITIFGCYNKTHIKKITSDGISSLKFIGEKVIPKGTVFQNTIVGGLSGIEYVDGSYYVISDDKDKPVRLYELKFKYSSKIVSDIEIASLVKIENNDKFVDPESIRYDPSTNHFFWTSEGAIRKGISPAVYEIEKNGKPIKKYITPSLFEVSSDDNKGPRQNGTFECLSMSNSPDYFWVGMELPLKQDGEEPSLVESISPVRISKINKKTGDIEFQFAYHLDPIPKDSKPKGGFKVNGLPEILSIDDKSFLFVERAYASGYSNGGNTVKIYKVEISNATDVKYAKTLKDLDYTPAKKVLLFDFEMIRNKLTNGIVDNIEGICFGQTLPNGNKSIVVISDDNFSKFNPQLNQIIVLEVMP